MISIWWKKMERCRRTRWSSRSSSASSSRQCSIITLISTTL